MGVNVIKLDRIKRLTIIGNGFDIHHGLPSLYTDFENYIKLIDSHTYDRLDRYFGAVEGFWSSFESHLADVDVQLMIDDASALLCPYGAED